MGRDVWRIYRVHEGEPDEHVGTVYSAAEAKAFVEQYERTYGGKYKTVLVRNLHGTGPGR